MQMQHIQLVQRQQIHEPAQETDRHEVPGDIQQRTPPGKPRLVGDVHRGNLVALQQLPQRLHPVQQPRMPPGPQHDRLRTDDQRVPLLPQAHQPRVESQRDVAMWRDGRRKPKRIGQVAPEQQRRAFSAVTSTDAGAHGHRERPGPADQPLRHGDQHTTHLG
jgi:hypothetical protein